MRTLFAFFVAALALVASACGAPAPNPMDSGTTSHSDVVTTVTDTPVVMNDAGTNNDAGPTPDVVTVADSGTPSDSGPTSMDLPAGMPYNPGPGGNAGIPCQANLTFDRWEFGSTIGMIYGGFHDGMWRISLENSGVPTAPDANYFVFSIGNDGQGWYWNNFGHMPTDVHCRAHVVNTTTCDTMVFECYNVGIDPRTGGEPMPGGTITARRLGDG